MDKVEANKLVRDKLRGYRLQRSNETWNNMGLNSIAEAFRINSVNIALLPDTMISIGTATAFLMLLLYEQQKSSHYLTKKIKKLENLQYDISSTDYVEDMTKDEFIKHLSLR